MEKLVQEPGIEDPKTVKGTLTVDQSPFVIKPTFRACSTCAVLLVRDP